MVAQSSSNLTEEQRELFARLLLQEGVEDGGQASIPRRSRSGELPLSYAQQRLWFLQRFGADNGAYNIPGFLRLKGSLNVEALRLAVAQIVDRHEALRTSLVEREGKPIQVIGAPAGLEVPLIDLGAHPEHEREEAAQTIVRAQAFAPFDLSRPPMIRATILRLRPDDHILLVVMHHVASDGWSLGVFANEFRLLYEAFVRSAASPLPELPIQYADYAAWQREWLTGEVEERQLGYWRKQLADVPDLELPMAGNRPAIRSEDGGRVDFKITASLRASLERIGQEDGATLFMVTLAVFQLLLHRYSGQLDIAIGTPIAGRTRRETEGLIGFFVNTLVMRTDFSGNPSFRQLLARIRELALHAYANQDMPFDRLVMELDPDRQVNKTPLFQALFALQNLPDSLWDLPGLEAQWTEGVPGREQFDLILELKPYSSGLQGTIGYRTDMFDSETVERMASHFVTLIESVCAAPQALIGQLELLPQRERRQVLEDWNRTQANYPGGSLHGLFEQQVERTPDRIAILDAGGELTYSQLDLRANRLAHYLRARGLGPQARVGVCLERSADIAVALLGILKAGAAYVPLDPAYPADRLRFMLEDSRAGLVLTHAAVAGALPRTGALVVLMDAQREAIDACPAVRPQTVVESGDAAYIIYTSGSTGMPKGTVIEHASAVTLIHWARELHSDEELAGMLAATSICFDLSVYEIFLPLCWGGTAIMAKNALHLETLEHAGRVRIINTVPSAIAELVRLGAVPQGVLTVNLAGEVLKRSLVEQIYQNTNVQRVINLYGPTEDTTYSTYAALKRGDPDEVTIGKPIANTRAYVLDERLQPTPIGIPGELCLAGGGLARCYLNRPDLTAERFIPDPFSERGERMYRTGDRACWLANGELRFHGRRDQQVKLRGYRIELGEIETALREQECVGQAVVIAREDEPGQKRLAGYVTTRAGKTYPGSDALRDSLLRRLPEYMVPPVIVELDAMPLTPNGKVDRKRLPAPDAGRPSGSEYFAPTTATQEVLAGIWTDILGLERVGVRDNFFRAGGHSLLATQVISRVRELLRIDAPVREMFEAPTIDEFSKALVRREAKPGQTERIAAIFQQVRATNAPQGTSR